MITKISLRNYKSFDCVSIPIKPITILLGANNTGKSSIINALMMLRQTAEETAESFDQPLKIIGDYVYMGPVKNLFPKKKTTKPLEIILTVSSNKFLDIREQMIKKFISTLDFIMKSITKKKQYESIPILDPNHKITIDKFQKYYDYHIDFLNNYKRKFKDYQFYSSILGNISEYNFTPIFHSNIISILDFLLWLKKNLLSNEFIIKYSLKTREKDQKTKLYISKFELFNENNRIITIDVNNKNSIKIQSDINFSEEDLKVVSSVFSFDNPIFDCFNSPKKTVKNTASSIYIIDFFNTFLQEFRLFFLKGMVNRVDPLRAFPQRFYVVDQRKFYLDFDTLKGQDMVGVLKNKEIIEQVNKWFEKFGLQITVKELQDEIHKLTINDKEIELNIYDVGFGISQLLPIIIKGFMSKNGTLTMVEQPEIHLHPKLQADLADLFIDIVNSQDNRSLIIETHSEYLLRRLRRRISEGKIKSNQVSICLFENINTFTSKIEIAEIEDKGYFEWPKDFMDNDLLDDITEFIKNQIVL